jgi:signal transduction histidine kinase/ligand-binding sensor domain-containing protein
MTKWLFGALTALLFIQPCLSQEPDLQDHVITQFGMEEGLPQSTVNDIIQSQDGYIWIATNGGLVRFDGNSFTTYDRSNTPKMRFDRIIKLYEDRNGILWVTTDNGLLRMKNGEVETHVFSSGTTVKSPSDMEQDENDVLWATVFDKIYKYSGENFIEVPESKDPELIQKALNSKEGVWLVNKKKLYKTIGDSVVVVRDLGGEISSELLKIVEHPVGSGALFIGTLADGILKYENGNLTWFNTENGLPANNFISFEKDRHGNLFVNVFGALAIWNGTHFEKFIPFDAESESISFQSIIEDNEGNYWIGTAADGLFRMSRSIITMIDRKNGLKNEKMLALLQLKDGSALLSTNCGGIYHWENGEITDPKIDFIAGDGCFWSMYEDSRGRLWFGARGVYVTNSLDEPGTFLEAEEGFSAAEVFAITEDKNGNIWIATSDFLVIYNDGIIRKYTEAEGLYYSDARVLFEDEDGTMWVGTGMGLNTIKNEVVQKIELLPAVENQTDSGQPNIRAIHKDDDGVMWIGTYGHGIFRIEDGEIENVTTAQGLFDNIVSHIIEDESGNFWMGSNRGISTISKSDLNAVIDGKIKEVRAYSYGTADGMNSAETNGGFQPSAFTDSLGQIYFPTVDGVAVVSAKNVDANDVPPPVYIEHIRTNEAALPITGSITIPHDTPYLQIQYTAINFTDPKKVEFKYRIMGLNDSWIEVGGNREALFSRMPPGEYTFQVIASNNDGVWNEEGASLAITVVPPFWQTNWFYSIIALLFITIGPVVYFVRVKSLEKENLRQKRFSEKLIESQEKERRRIASELHDGLGQQILVIKNRAELAQMQADNKENLSDQLNEILQSAIISIQDVRSISHGLRPIHLEKFGLTEAIETLFDKLESTSKIEWSYHLDNIDGLIPKDKEINFYRVIQEGTNNILKHSGASEASMMTKNFERYFKTVLSDDGKGFELKNIESMSGLGFLGMKERVEALGGTFKIHSGVGKGTSLSIKIPFKNDE